MQLNFLFKELLQTADAVPGKKAVDGTWEAVPDDLAVTLKESFAEFLQKEAKSPLLPTTSEPMTIRKPFASGKLSGMPREVPGEGTPSGYFGVQITEQTSGDGLSKLIAPRGNGKDFGSARVVRSSALPSEFGLSQRVPAVENTKSVDVINSVKAPEIRRPELQMGPQSGFSDSSRAKVFPSTQGMEEVGIAADLKSKTAPAGTSNEVLAVTLTKQKSTPQMAPVEAAREPAAEKHFASPVVQREDGPKPDSTVVAASPSKPSADRPTLPATLPQRPEQPNPIAGATDRSFSSAADPNPPSASSPLAPANQELERRGTDAVKQMNSPQLPIHTSNTLNQEAASVQKLSGSKPGASGAADETPVKDTPVVNVQGRPDLKADEVEIGSASKTLNKASLSRTEPGPEMPAQTAKNADEPSVKPVATVTSTPTETRHTELLPTQFAPVSSAVSEERVSLPLPMAVVSGEFAPRHQLSFASQTIPQAAPQYTVPADELSSMLGRLAQQRLGSGATTTELILEPQELGRIRVTLTGGESGGQIAIIVERGETLDLVRRHVDLVRSDLRASGWEATEFSLSRESFGSSDNNNGDDNLRPDEPDDRQLESSDSSEDFEPGPDNRKPIDGGLDLRV